jgi:hypothetical protein
VSIATPDPDDFPEGPREIPPQIQWALDQFYADAKEAIREWRERKRPAPAFSAEYARIATEARQKHPQPVRPGPITFPEDLHAFCPSSRPERLRPHPHDHEWSRP